MFVSELILSDTIFNTLQAKPYPPVFLLDLQYGLCIDMEDRILLN